MWDYSSHYVWSERPQVPSSNSFNTLHQTEKSLVTSGRSTGRWKMQHARTLRDPLKVDSFHNEFLQSNEGITFVNEGRFHIALHRLRTTSSLYQLVLTGTALVTDFLDNSRDAKRVVNSIDLDGLFEIDFFFAFNALRGIKKSLIHLVLLKLFLLNFLLATSCPILMSPSFVPEISAMLMLSERSSSRRNATNPITEASSYHFVIPSESAFRNILAETQ